MLIDEDVSRALSGEFGRGDSEHVGAATEAVREEQNVSVASGRGREGAEVIDADSDAGPFR